MVSFANEYILYVDTSWNCSAQGQRAVRFIAQSADERIGLEAGDVFVSFVNIAATVV